MYENVRMTNGVINHTAPCDCAKDTWVIETEKTKPTASNNALPLSVRIALKELLDGVRWLKEQGKGIDDVIGVLEKLLADTATEVKVNEYTAGGTA